MARFMDGNFLLGTRAARRLYHEHAARMPIYDYHCHLPVREISENRKFDTITQAWLAGDHYKWRAMRACGVPERLITGNAMDEEKFTAWAATVPATIGNPLYHWSHLELRRYFGITRLLSSETCREIYRECSVKLSTDGFRVRELLRMMNVRVLCTTDDPADSLEYHARLRDDRSFPITVVPVFRPETALAIEEPGRFNEWIDRLQQAADVEIGGWQLLIQALRLRRDFFHQMGCRLADASMEEPYADAFKESQVNKIFLAIRKGRAPSQEDGRVYKSALLLELGRMYAERKWAWQLHMGALRKVNSRFADLLGADAGFDAMGDFRLARPLARLLDTLEREGNLPKTILYNLNPADNAVIAAMINCFQDGHVRGKVQFGPAWWFDDQKEGMEDQMSMLARMGLLSLFTGMLTDSRSFLSFPRHEYFRRVLCGMLGDRIKRGEIPCDFTLMGKMVEDICWNNAVAYFQIALKEEQRGS